MELKGTTAIITGGSGGLGRVICDTFAAAGANLVVVYGQSRDIAEGVVERAVAAGVEAIAMQADVTAPDSATKVAEAALGKFGRIDVLVNDAAFNKWIPFQALDELTLDLWQQMLTTNLTAPMLYSKAVAPAMRQQQQGRIINITSVAGLAPTGSSIGYAVSKAGLIHLTRCLAVALAPHVLVNSVAPGGMAGTKMTANLDPEYAATARKQSLIGDYATKEDVARQVLEFARTDSITGQTIVVDGGRIFH